MDSPLAQTADFPEGHRITRAGGSLFIESIADHPVPLRLRRDQLAGFGLHFGGGGRGPFGMLRRDEHLLPLRRALFGLAILAAALSMLLIIPSVLSGR